MLRSEPKGGAVDVTWAEFVEAGLSSGYRRATRVPMKELRRFIEVLRDEFQVPYPLADRRPLAVGQQLVLEAQKAALAPDFWLVADVAGHLSFLPAAEEFWQRIEWDDDATAGRWRVAGPQSPVVLDPRRRSGRPSIRGISPQVIWAHHEAGEDDHDIAEDDELAIVDIRWALSFELDRQASRAA